MSVLKTFTVTGHIATAFVARFFSRTKAQQILDLRAQIFSVSCSPASPRIFEHQKNGIIAHF